MLKTTGEPLAILYGLSVLDPVNQIGFAVMRGALGRSGRFEKAPPELEAIAEEARTSSLVIIDLDERTELVERISGSRDGTLSPLAVAEFAWRDAALALARSDEGRGREVATATYERSAESFRGYLDGVRDLAEQIVKSLLATFDASTRVLADPSVTAAFGVKPMAPQWVIDDGADFTAASTLSAICEELEPEPLGRLSAFEVQVLKRLSVRRRKAVQLFADGELDPAGDPTPFIDWAQSLDEFRLASTARALRAQRTLEPNPSQTQVNRFDTRFLSPKVVEFLADCAAGGT